MASSVLVLQLASSHACAQLNPRHQVSFAEQTLVLKSTKCRQRRSQYDFSTAQCGLIIMVLSSLCACVVVSMYTVYGISTVQANERLVRGHRQSQTKPARPLTVDDLI